MKKNFCSNCGLPVASLSGLFVCPACHMALSNAPRGPVSPGPWQPVIFDGGGTWQEYQTMQSLGSSPFPALPSGQEDNADYEGSRRSPARSPEFMADVLVPAGQAVLVGVSATIASSVLLLAVEGTPWWMGPMLGLLVFAGALWFFVIGNRSQWWNDEKVSRKVIKPPKANDKDVEIGLNVRHENGDGKFVREQKLTLPKGVTQEMYYEFAKGATRRGAKLAVDDWTGAGKIFSKKVYGKLLDVLMVADIVAWKDPDNEKLGRELTDDGKRALLAFCAEYEA